MLRRALLGGAVNRHGHRSWSAQEWPHQLVEVRDVLERGMVDDMRAHLCDVSAQAAWLDAVRAAKLARQVARADEEAIEAAIAAGWKDTSWIQGLDPGFQDGVDLTFLAAPDGL